MNLNDLNKCNFNKEDKVSFFNELGEIICKINMLRIVSKVRTTRARCFRLTSIMENIRNVGDTDVNVLSSRGFRISQSTENEGCKSLY